MTNREAYLERRITQLEDALTRSTGREKVSLRTIGAITVSVVLYALWKLATN